MKCLRVRVQSPYYTENLRSAGEQPQVVQGRKGEYERQAQRLSYIQCSHSVGCMGHAQVILGHMENVTEIADKARSWKTGAVKCSPAITLPTHLTGRREQLIA